MQNNTHSSAPAELYQQHSRVFIEQILDTTVVVDSLLCIAIVLKALRSYCCLDGCTVVPYLLCRIFKKFCLAKADKNQNNFKRIFGPAYPCHLSSLEYLMNVMHGIRVMVHSVFFISNWLLNLGWSCLFFPKPIDLQICFDFN